MNTATVYKIKLNILSFAVVIYSQTVPIPGGTFTMGNGTGVKDEAPPHSVILSSFSINANEVSYAQYDSCVKRGACTPPHYDDGKCLMWTSTGIRRVRVPKKYRSPRYPVVCVSWHQARTYCRSKGKKLPTEAQWEYAALSGTNNTYSWGNQQPSSSRCIHSSEKRPAACGSYKPNSRGLYDMTGNVWEWTRDRYGKDYYSVSKNKDPTGPSVGRYRVIRGGGWYSTRSQLRIRNRQWFVGEKGEVSIGIRCVK